MPITSTVIRDTPELTEYRDADPAIGFVGYRVEWKPGTVQYNLAQTLLKARQALAANVTFLAIANPTAAQVATQSKALTRQVDALIRIVVNELDSTAGT
jgi:hypothetical protein